MIKMTMIPRAIVWASAMLASGLATAELQRPLGPARVFSEQVQTKSLRTASHKALLANVSQDAILRSAVPASQDKFGSSVAIDGNTAVVGAFGNDEAPLDGDEEFSGDGAVEVFLRSGNAWALQQRILPGDLAEDDQFGWSVAISGDTLVVGSPLADAAGSDSGAVYVFTRSAGTWALQGTRLTGDLVGVSDNFGYSVAIEGDTLIASARHDLVNSVNRAGAAYVFTRTAGVWTQQARLIAPTAIQDDLFGNSVDLSGDYAIVGVEESDTATRVDSGAAHLFRRVSNVWSHQSRFAEDAEVSGRLFGRAVAIDGSTVAISIHTDNFSRGRVNVYTGSGSSWALQQSLVASDGASEDFFGHALALRGSTLLVGAYQADLAALTERGAAYTFQFSGTWNQIDKYFASDSDSQDRFGFGVALTNAAAVVGAPNDDDTTSSGQVPDAGSAFVFHRGTATTTVQIINPSTMTYGQEVTFTAQVNGGTPTGNVEFRNGAAVLATVPLNGSFIASTTMTLPAGSYSITAYYMGDATHVPSNSTTTAVTVNKASTSAAISRTVGTNPSTYGQSVSFRAAIAVTPPGVGPATGSVEFRDNGVLVATVSLIAGEATYTTSSLAHNTGTAHPISATYLGTANFNGSSAGPLNHVVNKATVSLSLVSTPNPSFVGQNTALTATVTGGLNPTGTVTFFDGISLLGSNPVSGGVATRNTTALTAGSHNLQATYAGDDNHLDTQTPAPIVHVVFQSANVSVTKTNNANSVQSGQPTTYVITVSNLGAGDVDGLLLTDTLNPAYFEDEDATWSCAPAGICAQESGNGSIDDLALDLPQGTSVTITLIVPVLLEAESGISNTASLSLPSGYGDPNPADNTDTDSDSSGLFGDGFED